MPDFLKSAFGHGPEVAPLDVLLRLTAALALGAVVAWIYRRTRKRTEIAASFPITLVLLSVFVPVAFIAGISGQLFRQFAVAVSVSMLISALNALTLSPALCSVLLKREGSSRRGLMRCCASR